MDILVNVSSQKLRIPTNMRNIVAESQKFVRFVFNLSSDWDDLTAFAQFQQDGKSYNVYLDEENSVSLPYEIKTGECSVMLYGTDDEVMTPTNAYKFNVQINELVEDGESIEITKSLYSQLVAKVNLLEVDAKTNYGSPLTASSPSEMTEHQKVYVYTGETGEKFKNGYWYYYKDGDWEEGGIYNSVAIPDNITSRINAVENELSEMATSAAQTAETALAMANNAENHISELDNAIDSIYTELENVSIDPDDLGLYQDPDTYYVYPTYRGIRSENGVPLAGGGGGSGGGGGDVISAVLTVENTTGWLSKTISDGAECPVSFYWTSIEDGMETGDGVLRITVNDVVRASLQIQQKSVSVDLAPFLNAGINKVKVRISDSYDQGKTTTFTITSVSLSLSSTFDTTQPYSSAFAFPCTPVGNVEKTIHILVDNTEVATQTTSLSARQINLVIPAQSHGGHSLKAYFTADINGETVSSNVLYYEFIFLVPLNNTVIITSSFNKDTVDQYSSVPIPYTVYNPASLTSEVSIYVNNVLISTQTVDRTEQSYTIKANQAGTETVRIESGNAQPKTIQFTVVESTIDVEAETQDLALYLTAQGRSNNEEHPEVWNSGNISAQLTGFTWKLDGWQTDDDSINVLRLNESARVTIPYKLFGTDFKSLGKTIEIEFATRDVIDYNTTILSCMSDNMGLKITPQMVEIRGAQTNISTIYKDNEHIRLSIVVEKQSVNRLILIYINGIMSRAIQYASGERFSQLTPVDITIGSDDCGIDIYNIRVYDNDLNRQQILDNWIADTQVGSLMLERYTHNTVYDAYGYITPTNLPADLPYWIIEATQLPQSKGDVKVVSGQYKDKLFPSKSFTFEGVEIDVQGTSSAIYYRKNYDLKFKQGFVTPNGQTSSYAIRTGSIPFNRFVLKADVASSEGANNTELTMFYNDSCPYKVPEMLENSKVRWGIEGIPCVVFWHNPDDGSTTFMGKYNFNLPKRCAAPLGYSGNDESWEVEWNNTPNVKFQDDDFDSVTWDEKKQVYYPSWYDDFEARFPSSDFRDITKLKTLVSWVKSTWRDTATGNALPSPVTYRLPSGATINKYPDDTTYTAVEEVVDGKKTGVVITTFNNDTPAYRLSRFRMEFGDYFEIESATFYYLFTEMMLMIDSRAKNMFIGFHGSHQDGVIDRKAVFEPYDMDTAIGTNNSGVLMFGYALEDTDTVSSIISGGEEGGKDAPVFNAQDSVLWQNFRDAFRSEISNMYESLRASGAWSYQAINNRFINHQSKWCEAIYNEDAYTKYLVPLIEPVTYDEDTGQYIRTDRYLTMLQGSKAEQRKWWLSNRFKYMDSKYIVGDATNRVISMRIFASGTITLTPAIDMYVSMRFGGGSTPRQIRTTANHPVSFSYTFDTGVNELETWIYSADMITDVGDLSVFYGNEFDFSRATKLQRLKIGDSSPTYSNANLNTLNVQNSVLLEHIDVRNCPNLKATINLEGSPRIKEAYFDGTSISGCDLSDGCAIETLHLPSTIATLTLVNLSKLTDFQCPSLANVSRLMLTNMSTNVIDPLVALTQIKANSQVNIQGLYFNASTAQDIETFLDLLDTMRGVSREKNSSGEWMYHDYDTAQISGTIHIEYLTGAQISAFRNRDKKYPYLNIVADHTTAVLTYMTYDGSEVIDGFTETIIDGGNGTKTNNIARQADARYTYTPNGWSRVPNGNPDSNAIASVVEDRTVYAAYDAVGQKYTVRFYNGTTLLQTVNNVLYGGTAQYTGSTPVHTSDPDNYEFNGWSPSNMNIEGNTDCYAQYRYTGSVARTLIDRTISGDYSNDRVTSIGRFAFNNCSSLTTADFPVATSIGDCAFQGCSGLITANIPVATSIGQRAFYNCIALTTADFPAVTSVGDYAFESSSKLTTADFPVATSLGTEAFYGCIKLTTTNFPAVTSVGSYAFNACTSLTTLDFPVATSILANAFRNCTYLTTLILRNTQQVATLYNTNAFSGATNCIIYVPDALVEDYKAASNWSTYADRIKGLSELPTE